MKNHWIKQQSDRHWKEHLTEKYPDHIWAGDGMILKSFITDKNGEWLHMVVVTTHSSSHLFVDGKEVT